MTCRRITFVVVFASFAPKFGESGGYLQMVLSYSMNAG